MTNLLQRYAKLKVQELELKAELSELEAALQEVVTNSGEMAGYGFRARFKPGRRSVDHETAWREALAAAAKQNDLDRVLILNEVQGKHTTTTTTVAWAKVTTEVKLNIDPYTTKAEPQFVIELIK